MAQGNSIPNIPYRLFVYREELRRFNKHEFKLFKTKLHLTEELVLHSIGRIMEYNMEELININRGINLTRELKRHIDYIKRMHAVRNTKAQIVERI